MPPATANLLNLCAAEIMSRQVLMVPREMSVQGAARMLARANVTGAPVVDENGRCIGVLSATDFMHWVEHDHPESTPAQSADCMCKPWQIPEGAEESACRVENFMTKDPVLVVASTRIGDLARMMMDAHIHRLIVVDTAQRPVGVVSSIDILAAIARADAKPAAETIHDGARAGATYQTASGR